MLKPEVKKKIEAAVRALEEKKAEDIRVIDISEVSVISDAFIIAHANNTNQLRALVDHVEEEMEKADLHPHAMEGSNTSGWVLIDYTDFILHIFDRENRLFYNLEKMWRDGVELNVEELLGGEAQ